MEHYYIFFQWMRDSWWNSNFRPKDISSSYEYTQIQDNVGKDDRWTGYMFENFIWKYIMENICKKYWYLSK